MISKKDNDKITSKQNEFIEFLEEASSQNRKYKRNNLSIILNFLIYGSFVAIGIFLIYLYSAYIFINK